MEILLISIHVLAAFVLVTVVLLQHGKGADVGAAFGGGASQTVFGSRGAGNFLTKMTTLFVVLFMGTSISLAYFTTPRSVLDEVDSPTVLPEDFEPENYPGATPIEPEGAETEGDVLPEGFEAIPSPAGASDTDETPTDPAAPTNGESEPGDPSSTD